jgi:hypothetical protein
MHRNPVKRGLVLEPEQWKWSSFRFYMYGEEGAVTITRFEELKDLPTNPATVPSTHSIQKQD